MEIMVIRVSKLRVVLYKVLYFLGYKDLCVVGFCWLQGVGGGSFSWS